MSKLAMIFTAAVLVAGCHSHNQPAPSAGTTAASAASGPPTSRSSTSNTLRGATATLSANYPTVDDVFTNTVTGKVPVSWPKGTLYATRGPMVQVLASFDVADTTVTETFLTTASLAVGTFNGPVYTFKGAPVITNVTVDPGSDHEVDPVNISFTADSISVNDSGIHVTDGAKQILRVEFSTL
ncbi:MULTISPECIES: hypothetical protein [Mycobacterium]|uniref:Lipoprotein n=2 Tax=Mycobacterium persicum TaxID=1487726 RepID=A0AB38UZK8_9MYCO|nr:MULTISPECIES: hypothetical protein [Mycobacterium]VAZ80191.1 hypothetical protein LAUMK15_05245 [Mycobacterium persicum]VAZ86077.1 hypothetical protein LAUMK42_04920 [Mycobacterium persicum]VBA30065.1 hypothetical protein LAUMK4_04945 [Mycobacterium persicum]